MSYVRIVTVAAVLPLIVMLIGCDSTTPAEPRPRSEMIVGDWITSNGYVLSVKADGSATTNDPQFDDLEQLGITELDWSYDDTNDRFILGATYRGTWFGFGATARWSGDDRVCFEIERECGPYWARRGT